MLLKKYFQNLKKEYYTRQAIVKNEDHVTENTPEIAKKWRYEHGKLTMSYKKGVQNNMHEICHMIQTRVRGEKSTFCNYHFVFVFDQEVPLGPSFDHL